MPILNQILALTKSKPQTNTKLNKIKPQPNPTKTNQSLLLSGATKPNLTKLNLREEKVIELNLFDLVQP